MKYSSSKNSLRRSLTLFSFTRTTLRKGKLVIQKRDSQTGEVLPGAQFRISTAAGCEVGLDGVIGTSSPTQNCIVRPDRVLCKAV